MKRRVHVSCLLSVASLGVLIGIILSLFTEDYFLALPWLMFGLSLLIISLINRKLVFVFIILAAGLLIGLWRGSQNYPSQNVYHHFVGKQVNLFGVVSEDAVFDKNGQQQIKLKEVKLNGTSLLGQVWVSTGSGQQIKRSDQLIVNGTLSKGFGSFSATVYRAEISQVITVKHGDVGREVRDWFAGSVKKVVGEPESSLGLGFLTGQNSTLPENLNNNLKVLGLTHIIVASGYNLTILVRLSRRTFAKVSKYLATLTSTLLIIGFITVTGSSPSMTRAGLITGLSLAAWYFGRKIHPLVLLPVSAAITVILNPFYLWGDLGWYLSFAAFAGVIITAPLLVNYFWGNNPPNEVARVVVETFSAQLLTVPLIAFVFGQYAPLALASNLLILPLIPLAMIFTFVAGLSFILINPLANLISLPAELILKYMTFIAAKLSSLPIAKMEVSFSVFYLTFAYMAIALLCVWLWQRTKHDFRQDSIVE